MSCPFLSLQGDEALRWCFPTFLNFSFIQSINDELCELWISFLYIFYSFINQNTVISKLIFLFENGSLLLCIVPFSGWHPAALSCIYVHCTVIHCVWRVDKVQMYFGVQSYHVPHSSSIRYGINKRKDTLKIHLH